MGLFFYYYIINIPQGGVFMKADKKAVVRLLNTAKGQIEGILNKQLMN